ncbi:MAG TPA: AAA family ATPase, partial [Caldilineaceae bacterium]|nr:AAA family ATPase [Caldilineaceae bacterium]
RMAQMQKELEADLAAVEEEYAGRSDYAKGFARMPHAKELAAIRARYGEGLDARSHGESFLALFQARFVPSGLYLLDEPEAPLSPLRQVGFLALLHEMVQQESQFIIATHSPILMAFPGATILSFDEAPVRSVPWEQLEHVTITRDFLNQPGAFLANLT